MSKTKPKDKKQETTSLIEKQFQLQKRDVIDYQFTIKKLQEKLALKISQNEKLNKELEQTRQLSEEKERLMNEKIEDLQQSNKEHSEKLLTYDITNARYKAKIDSLTQDLQKQKHQRIKEVESTRIRLEADKSRLGIELKKWEGYANEKQANQLEISELKQKLKNERQDKIRELADKEREKVQATDKLRDDMLKQIRQMHTKYVSLKKEQLDTTTRLTILQNHQLTSELEYQSKQTEKLIFKEEDLQQKVKQMTQELIIHKEVEEQLAKRAHFSKGVIKKLTDRVNELEQELNKGKSNYSSKKITNKLNSSYNIQSEISKGLIQTEEANNKEILVELEKQLGLTQKKYAEMLSKQEAIIKEKENLSRKLKKFENCTNYLTKIMIHFSQILLAKVSNENPSELHDDSIDNEIMKLDLEKLRNQQIDNWAEEEVSIIVKLLLYLIKPYLTQRNLTVPSIRRFLSFQDRNQNNQNSERKLPKLMCDQNSIRGLKDLPINVSTKIVGSNLREWGATIRQGNSLKKKYKITQSNR